MNKKNHKYNLALFGSDINNSLSPLIHNCFAKLENISIDYKLIQCVESDFLEKITAFFANGGVGANITMPFKTKACTVCDALTDAASVANSVNTLIHRDDLIIGENTDGAGFIQDLLHSNIDIQSKRVLIIGAGGAAKGIVAALQLYNCRITVVNRSSDNLAIIKTKFDKIIPLSYEQIAFDKQQSKYDIIINTTPTSSYNTLPQIPDIIYSNTICYDLTYSFRHTIFEQHALKCGANMVKNGLGMLIEQASQSFYNWFRVKPNTTLTRDFMEEGYHAQNSITT